jgi:uncharacterized protein (DUF2249 family)
MLGSQTDVDARPGAVSDLCDDQTILLWQACAYAADLVVATESGQDVGPPRDALLGFIHYALLPYLRFEEREVTSWTSRDERLNRRQLADHDRIRNHVDGVEATRHRRPLTMATDALIARLDRHIRREQGWVADVQPGSDHRQGIMPRWLSPLLADHVDLDALSGRDRDMLVLERLQRMRRGDVVHLRASADLHPLWCQQHAGSPGSHVWVYEEAGPREWIVRVTRRDVASL